MLGVPNQGIWRLLSFKAIWKMGVDIVILTKTKLTNKQQICNTMLQL